MEAVFKDLSKTFKEISIIAFTWLKDMHCLIQEQGVKIKKIRQDTQDHKQGIKANIMEIFCIKTKYKLHRDRL